MNFLPIIMLFNDLELMKIMKTYSDWSLFNEN